jgi:photosystem II stability/assembly factor-like uncharacterized protein
MHAVLRLLTACFALGLASLLPAWTAEDAVAAGSPERPRAGVTTEATPAGEDVEGGPLTEGEQFRMWTPLTPGELNAVDPSFRSWAESIRDGRADKRIMRLYWYNRWRLEPFDVAVPSGWREEGVERLRDRELAGAAARSFEQQRTAAQDEAGPLQGQQPPAPEGSILDAAQRRNEQPESAGVDMGTGVSSFGVWVPVGPYDIAGRTTGLDRPADEPDTLYAAVADGGVWRTRDRGQTWERLSDFEATLSGGAILVDPTDPETIYFGTGEGNGAIDNYPGIGVLKSTNAGLTWTASNNFSSDVRQLAMHPSEPTRLWAAGSSGCYVSTDAGATFSLVSAPGLPTGTAASDVLVRPDNADWVYCAIWGGADSGIYRTTDRGGNWTRLSGGLPAPNTTGRIALAISKSNPDILLAGIDLNSGTIYTTTDGGDNWTNPHGTALNYCGGQCWYDNAVGIDPVNPDIMYAGGVSAYKSTDAGVNWSVMSSGVHVDHHDVFTPSGGEVLLANDGGIYHSSNHGSSWTEWSFGMDTAQYYGICRAPNDDVWAMGGTQDNGSHRRRQSDGWVQVLGADGGMCMHGPDGSGIVLGEYQNMNIRRSTTGGNGFSDANGGIPSGEPHPWVGTIVVDPSDRNNMYAGTDRVYRSMDARATSWVNVSAALHCASVVGCGSMSAFEVAPSDSNIAYAGFTAASPFPPFTDGRKAGIYRSSDVLAATPTWTDVGSTSFPHRSTRRIRVHPDDPDTVYLIAGGYGAGKIWKTTDGGANWADHTGDLPDVPVNDILIDADNPGTLLVATDLAVYRSDDDGATWYGFSSGLPTAAAIEMTYNRSTGKLRVGTHGRSMWDWQEASSAPVAVPDGGTAGGASMKVAKIDATTMRVIWDSRTCTAREYNLFYGDMDDVASRTYSGATCDLGTSGQADVAIPVTASGNAFFVIAGSDAAGTEGPHGYDSTGTPVSANGIGFCSITNQDALATCP